MTKPTNTTERTNKAAAPKVVMRPIDRVHPVGENDRLYKPIDKADPDFVGLVKSVGVRGITTPLRVVRIKGWPGHFAIVSGHRRHAAANENRHDEVPTILETSVEYDRDGGNIDAIVSLLADENRQRVKTLAEQAREAVVLTDRDDAYNALIEHRQEKSDVSDSDDVALKLGDRRARKGISDAKKPMLAAAVDIVNDLKEYWPLSDRLIHYKMLNVRPPRHAGRPTVRYENTLACYKDLCDLLIRARLVGLIPWSAIADATRPVTVWKAHQHAGAFIRDEVDNFAKVYWRDLMQSQPNQVEVVVEKLALQSVVHKVTQEYCIPTTVGKGYSSGPPRHAMRQRFVASGKQKLILLLLSDHDPDGEVISESFARSLRDDFQIDNLLPIKVAITGEHVRKYKLPPTMLAKKSSQHHGKFVEAHGQHAYELEALPPDVLQHLLREAIDSVIDVDAFNREVDAEAEDAKQIAAYRRVLLDTMAGADFDH